LCLPRMQDLLCFIASSSIPEMILLFFFALPLLQFRSFKLCPIAVSLLKFFPAHFLTPSKSSVLGLPNLPGRSHCGRKLFGTPFYLPFRWMKFPPPPLSFFSSVSLSSRFLHPFRSFLSLMGVFSSFLTVFVFSSRSSSSLHRERITLVHLLYFGFPPSVLFFFFWSQGAPSPFF